MTLAITTTLHTTFDEAVTRTRQALADQGFGVLTEIDVQATLRAKLDEDVENYLVLGACNPPLAHQAIDVDRRIGLLLPCNVVVRADRHDPGAVIVGGDIPRDDHPVRGQMPPLHGGQDVSTSSGGHQYRVRSGQRPRGQHRGQLGTAGVLGHRGRCDEQSRLRGRQVAVGPRARHT